MADSAIPSELQSTEAPAGYLGLNPGWYRDSADPSFARYWDGNNLSAERRPVSPPPPTSGTWEATDNQVAPAAQTVLAEQGHFGSLPETASPAGNPTTNLVPLPPPPTPMASSSDPAYEGLSPGWYRDSADPTFARYWDGTSLSEERRPLLTPATSSTNSYPTPDTSDPTDSPSIPETAPLELSVPTDQRAKPERGQLPQALHEAWRPPETNPKAETSGSPTGQRPLASPELSDSCARCGEAMRADTAFCESCGTARNSLLTTAPHPPTPVNMPISPFPNVSAALTSTGGHLDFQSLGRREFRTITFAAGTLALIMLLLEVVIRSRFLLVGWVGSGLFIAWRAFVTIPSEMKNMNYTSARRKLLLPAALNIIFLGLLPGILFLVAFYRSNAQSLRN
jgi:Protein of unknown function (DUF2510)